MIIKYFYISERKGEANQRALAPVAMRHQNIQEFFVAEGCSCLLSLDSKKGGR